MKALFFEPMAIWVSPHFETCLELMQHHLDQGDEIEFFACNGKIESCEPNFLHNHSRCLQCMSKRERGLSLLSAEISSKDFVRLTNADKEELSALQTRFEHIDDLKAYRIDGFDLGYAAASSLIHHVKVPEPDMSEHASSVTRLVRSAFLIYRSFLNTLNTEHVDRVYIMNGRFAAVRGVLRACQKLGVECVMHERGSAIDRYALFNNKLPHDRQEFVRKAKTAWQQAPKAEREEIATAFFTERKRGQDQSWFSFTKNQSAGLLPDHWDPSKRNIVIFNSSEFEFAGIGDEWRHPIYRTQVDGIAALVDGMKSPADFYRLWLRMHPNLRGVQDDGISRLYDLECSHFNVIGPESPISTYELIHAADTIVTFGSTVGIEAAFWGKVSVLLGTCFYRDLGGVYSPSTHEEALTLLTSELQPTGRQEALIYGYYQKTFGEPFKYYAAKSLFEGEFKGDTIKPSIPSEISRFLPRLLGNKLGNRVLEHLIDSFSDHESHLTEQVSPQLEDNSRAGRSLS